MDRRLTRSVRLKKYEAVYKEYIRNKSKSPESKKPVRAKAEKPKITAAPPKIVDSGGRGRKKPTKYNIFVREEGEKDKYKGLKPQERLVKIARAWKKHNLKTEDQSTKNGKQRTKNG